MPRGPLVVTMLLAASLLGLGGCGERLPSYRYRLTLTVEDAGVLHSASSVVEVRPREQREFASNIATADLTGQATLIELPGRRGLAGLLQGGPDGIRELDQRQWLWREQPTLALFKLYGLPHESLIEPALLSQLAKMRGKRSLELGLFPHLVAFGDIKDPKSEMQADPENLAATLGPGVRLVSAQIEVTDDQVSTGLTSKMPWLKNTKNYINGQAGCLRDQTCFRKAQFIRGVS